MRPAMPRFRSGLILCAVMAPATWAGHLRAAPADAPPPAEQAAPPASRTQFPPGAAVLLLGHAVKNTKGTVVGQIVNVIVDPGGQPLAAVLDYGGFLGVGHRKIAVAWQVLLFASDG